MAQKIIDKILNEYDEIRSREGFLRKKRVDKYHELYPELKEIKNEITAAGMKLASGIAANPEKAEELKLGYERETKELIERRKELLEAHEIPEDYDRIRHECELCEDTGYINNEKCRCFIAKKIAYTYERSNLSERMKNQTFDKFKLEYYSDVPESDGVSPRKRAEKALRQSQEFSENIDKSERSFMFIGNVGLGKTFLSGCIANRLIEKGYSVLYVRSSTLFTLLENKKFNRLTDVENEDMLESVYNCDLLIIDDLGAEIPSKFTAAFLHDLVNERMLNGKKMIMSTNYSTEELSKMYSPRFISRLYESFYVFRLTGTDIRKQQAYE